MTEMSSPQAAYETFRRGHDGKGGSERLDWDSLPTDARQLWDRCIQAANQRKVVPPPKVVKK